MKILIVLVICGLTDVTSADECTVNPNAINLARFGRACQSSVFPVMPRQGPDRAVDGVSETNSTLYPCVLTKLEYQPFWSVDLEESYILDVIHLVLREDGIWDCMENAVILVGDDPSYNNPVCATIKGVKRSQPSMKFSCSGMQGRFVTLMHPQRAGIISFCELSVYNQIPNALQ